MATRTTLKGIIKEAIVNCTKDLGLKQHPTVKVVDTTETYVMAATGIIYAKGLFIKTITRTECNYVLHINKNSIKGMLKKYKNIFGNKQAAYDYVYLIVCHELRHMWQYQEQFQVGETTGGFDTMELFDGHGSTPVEADANKYMISVAEKIGLKPLAMFMEMEQRSEGLVNQLDKDFNKEMFKYYLKALKQYNKVLYFIAMVLK